MRLILGSGSPRRLELLAQLGVVPDEVRPPDVDETPLPREIPRAYCTRITGAKIAATKVGAGEVALCADTTVALGRRILGKPRDEAEARAFLRMLSGRRHRVITAIAVKTSERVVARDVVTQVKLKRLSVEECDAYLATGDWQGKAGGYAIQGPAGAFVSWIEGSFSGVMGLPVHETAKALAARAAELGVAPATLAVAWAMAHPARPKPIISARTVDQLGPSLAALDFQMTPELYVELSSLSRQPAPATDRLEEA
jgi:septum formation protein